MFVLSVIPLIVLPPGPITVPINSGSILKLSNLGACGDSDIYICLSLPGKSSPKDWDFAAPESILKAAGGAITNLDNKELTYGLTSFQQGGSIVATNNRKTHGSICLEIKKIIEKNGIYPL